MVDEPVRHAQRSNALQAHVKAFAGPTCMYPTHRPTNLTRPPETGTPLQPTNVFVRSPTRNFRYSLSALSREGLPHIVYTCVYAPPPPLPLRPPARAWLRTRKSTWTSEAAEQRHVTPRTNDVLFLVGGLGIGRRQVSVVLTRVEKL